MIPCPGVFTRVFEERCTAIRGHACRTFVGLDNGSIDAPGSTFAPEHIRRDHLALGPPEHAGQAAQHLGRF